MLTLDVVTENLAVTLRATLAETLKEGSSESTVSNTEGDATYLATFSTARHVSDNTRVGFKREKARLSAVAEREDRWGLGSTGAGLFILGLRVLTRDLVERDSTRLGARAPSATRRWRGRI